MPAIRLPYALTSPLRTPRLVLRAMTSADVDDLHAYQSRDDVCEFLVYEPRSPDEVAAKVAVWAAALALRKDGDFWELAITRAADPGRVIGDLYFSIAGVADAAGEIGWALHPDFTGHGYMTEAAGAILSFAFDTLGLHRVRAVLDPRNQSSVALCRRLGMREEARFLEDVWFIGAWGDTAIYAILDREWRERVGSAAASASGLT